MRVSSGMTRHAFLAASAALSACAYTPPDAPPLDTSEAAATELTLLDASGRARAEAELDAEDGALSVRVEARDLAPGVYAAHVHAVGRCDPPAFESAGPHWNPTGAEHGRENPQGAHLGDLPNLLVGADRRGSVEYRIAGASLRGSSYPVADADGAALIVHARSDDYRTDPSGNAGARLACAVIAPAR